MNLKDKKLKWKIGLALASSILGFFIVLMLPVKIDSAKVHPLVRNLSSDNFKGLTSFGDGGTVMLLLTDESGNDLVLYHPRPLDREHLYKGRLFFDLDYSEPSAREISGYSHTTLKVAEIMRARSGSSPEISYEISRLTGRLDDKVRMWMSWIKSLVQT